MMLYVATTVSDLLLVPRPDSRSIMNLSWPLHMLQGMEPEHATILQSSVPYVKLD